MQPITDPGPNPGIDPGPFMSRTSATFGASRWTVVITLTIATALIAACATPALRHVDQVEKWGRV